MAARPQPAVEVPAVPDDNTHHETNDEEQLLEQAEDEDALSQEERTPVRLDVETFDEEQIAAENFDPVRFVYILTVEQPELMTRALAIEHVEHLKRLEELGKLELCGPFNDRKGGMVILKRVGEAEAKAIAEADPFVSSGAERYELRQLTVSCRENGHLGLG